MSVATLIQPVEAKTEASRAVKLRVSGLQKQYNQMHALRPTNLEVGNGEFLTLLGPSGSGKTTLLMMVAGLTPPFWWRDLDRRTRGDEPAAAAARHWRGVSELRALPAPVGV